MREWKGRRGGNAARAHPRELYTYAPVLFAISRVRRSARANRSSSGSAEEIKPQKVSYYLCKLAVPPLSAAIIMRMINSRCKSVKVPVEREDLLFIRKILTSSYSRALRDTLFCILFTPRPVQA